MSTTVNPIESWDDDPWDAFLADDDERDPEPEPGDFWPCDGESPFTDEQIGASFTARFRRGGVPCSP